LKTFKWCVDSYLAGMEGQWKNAKHAAQCRSTLETYAHPIIGKLPVQSIAIAACVEVLNQPQPDKANAGAMGQQKRDCLTLALAC
jgi:hypothetical protein